MQLFVSWSGQKSKEIAGVLENWLPRVIQNLTVFVSTGLPRGALWGPNLAQELERSSAGLLCLVPDSVDSPWLLFEAGALGMGVKGRPVYSVLFGVDEKDAPDPLRLFQLSPFCKTEFLKVMRELNKLIPDHALSESRLAEEFDRSWPQLQEAVDPVLRSIRPTKRSKFYCEELSGRAGAYERIADLLETKTTGWIHDTTWGRHPPDKILKREREARDRYLESRNRAAANGVAYKEIFSFTTQRLERIQEAIAESMKQQGGYDVRILEKGIDISIPDFFVTDAGQLILSHVNAAPQGGRRKFLYVECQILADLFHDWFEDCWEDAHEAAQSK
jgi:hypothetical protein